MEYIIMGMTAAFFGSKLLWCSGERTYFTAYFNIIAQCALVLCIIKAYFIN